MQFFEEESEPEPEDEEAEPPGEPQAAGAIGGGARGNLAQAHQVDPARSSIDQQALYYDTLLTKIDRHTEEAGHALQALQGASPHEQLRQRTAIGQRTRILQDELEWAKHHLRPEALEAVRHCCQQPPVRGQVFSGPQPSGSATGTPVQRPPGSRQPVQGPALFPFFGPGDPRPPSPPSGAPVTPSRGPSARQPPPPPDCVLRSQARHHPDGRHPDPLPRGSCR